ncbi:MAG: biotin transporter BioY [bacterium]|nr:biotin transporter BioY [bacterium]
MALLSLTQDSTKNWTSTVMWALVGSLLLTVSAKIQIPLGIVKISLQSLTVIGLGAVLGPRIGLAAIVAYLIEGAMGFPVFQSTPERGIGLAYMFGPTGGYLLGFAISSWTAGWLVYNKGWGQSFVSALGVMALGHVLIHLPGSIWLAQLFSWDLAIVTTLTFATGAALKTALGAAALTLWLTRSNQG